MFSPGRARIIKNPAEAFCLRRFTQVAEKSDKACRGTDCFFAQSVERYDDNEIDDRLDKQPDNSKHKHIE